MIWSIQSLLKHCNENQALVGGRWVPAKTLPGPLAWRIRAAWAVLTGCAEAFTWDDRAMLAAAQGVG